MFNEHYIQNQIRLWCGEHNILCFRCNVGRIRMYSGGYFDTGLPAGFSDLIVLPGDGIIIFVECKTATGRQREDQKKFQEKIEQLKYQYWICRSLESFIENYKNYKSDAL